VSMLDSRRFSAVESDPKEQSATSRAQRKVREGEGRRSASMMALAANGGGAKMTEALAPVSLLASATELKTGRPRWVWPPLPAAKQPRERGETQDVGGK